MVDRSGSSVLIRFRVIAGWCGGGWSAAEAAAAVGDNALAGDEVGAGGGQEAHGVGDVGMPWPSLLAVIGER